MAESSCSTKLNAIPPYILRVWVQYDILKHENVHQSEPSQNRISITLEIVKKNALRDKEMGTTIDCFKATTILDEQHW